MLNRVRDKIHNFKPIGQISNEEWQDIETKYGIAKAFLDEKNPIFILLKEALKSAEDMILENRVREVRDIHKISKDFKKIFITPKKIQDDELVGQIKVIRTLLAEIQSWMDRHNEAEQMEADGKIQIQRSKEDE